MIPHDTHSASLRPAFLLAAASQAEANSPLLMRFVNALMSRQLLNLFADLTMLDNPPLDREMGAIKDTVIQIIAPPLPPPPPPPPEPAEPEPSSEPSPSTPDDAKPTSPPSAHRSRLPTSPSLRQSPSLSTAHPEPGTPPPPISMELAQDSPARPAPPPPPPPIPHRPMGPPAPPAAPMRFEPKPVPPPSKKMKQFFWEVVPPIRLPGTFWVEPEDPVAGAAEGGGEGPPTLDWSLMEDMFAQVRYRSVSLPGPYRNACAVWNWSGLYQCAV